MLIETIKSVRGLVNGNPGLLDSLSFTDNRVPYEYQQAERTGGFQIVTLADPPYAVNVRIGGGLWHGVELDDLSKLIVSTTDAAQVILVMLSSNREELELKGRGAAHLTMSSLSMLSCPVQMRP